MIQQKNSKDCHICCLSEVLGIAYENIPKFYEYYPEYGNPENLFKEKYDEWLHKIGYVRIMADVKYDKEEGIVNIPYHSLRKYKAIANLNKKGRRFSHSVVIKVDDFEKEEIKMLDPDENSDFDLRDIEKIEFFLKHTTQEGDNG